MDPSDSRDILSKTMDTNSNNNITEANAVNNTTTIATGTVTGTTTATATTNVSTDETIAAPHKKPLSKWAQAFVDIEVPETVSDWKEEESCTVIEPTDLDVLIGRQPATSNYKGNQTFRTTITSQIDKYEAMFTRAAKSEFVLTMLTNVHKRGGRFLQKDATNGLWYEVPNHAAREKVGHTIRNEVAARKRDERRTKNRTHRKSKAKKSKSKSSKVKSTSKPPTQCVLEESVTAVADPKPSPPQPSVVDLTKSDNAPVLDDTVLDIFDRMTPEDLEPLLTESTGVGGSTDNDALLKEPTFWMLSTFDDSKLDVTMDDLVA